MEEDIIELISNKSEAFFKSQQKNDEDLSLEEKRTIVKDLMQSNRTIFLQRYGQYLNLEQLEYFQNDDCEDVRVQVNFLKENFKKNGIKIRNRRYQALQNMLKEGLYFSNSEMQTRNPFLFEEMIGKYMNEEEKNKLNQSNYATNYDRITFSSYLFERIRQIRMDTQSSYQEQLESEEIEDDVDDDDDNIKKEQYINRNISAQEKQSLKDEFLDIMIQNFLNGKDSDHFDYSNVDNDENLDLNPEFERDQEEKYFDADCN